MTKYILVIILLSSCDMSKKYSDNDLAAILKERYNQEFYIEENDFFFEWNKFRFTAVNKNLPEVKAFGSYNDNQSDIEENYLQMLHCYQGIKFMSDFLGSYYDKYAVDANIMSPLQENQEGSLPPFPDVARSKESDVIANFRIYLFDVVSKVDEDMLKGIVAAANHFNKSYYGVYTFTVYFWDPEFLKGKDFDKMKFGFNYNSDKYDDNFPEKDKYIKEELTFEFDASENPNITVERLKEMVAPYKEGKQYNRL